MLYGLGCKSSLYPCPLVTQWEKIHSPQFQASTGGLRTYLPRIRGGYVFILLFKSFQLVIESSFSWFCISLADPHHVVFRIHFFLSDFIRCSRLILYTSYPDPRISHFSKEAQFLLLENSVINEDVGVGFNCFHCTKTTISYGSTQYYLDFTNEETKSWRGSVTHSRFPGSKCQNQTSNLQITVTNLNQYAE